MTGAFGPLCMCKAFAAHPHHRVRRTTGGCMSAIALRPSDWDDVVFVEPLTRREKVVLSRLSENTTLEELATELFVSRNTIKSQVRSVYRKIGVSTRAEAVAWAKAAGLR